MKSKTSLFDASNSLFLGIDIQERLIPVMCYKDKVLKNANTLLKAAQIFGIKTLITEQYPKGLGSTCKQIEFESIEDLSKLEKHSPKPQCKLLEKISFSVFADEQICAFIKEQAPKNLFIFGIETHVCVLQSVIHALELGYKIWLIEDCLSSRAKENHQNALELMRDLGANITNVESVLFGHMLDAKNENFKAISGLIK
ncbi:hypothetical protein DMB92_07295 [Campylobacter sp. MIT 99-7217]|uniref:isochorismatase family protein n=1 Tax=Campylobacter sp. MIT 99-7217 TaxID=535091 RepID=UPI00115713F2|nr:isochorismatase family protein [Campylobacter sp. MIT 99-7217]TQR30617.1 hypothetical protein DMB92_07295 [Campylobacter sp. MIT 99-7217]